MELNRRQRQLHPEIIIRTEQTIANLGGQVWRDPKTDLLTPESVQDIVFLLGEGEERPSRQVPCGQY